MNHVGTAASAACPERCRRVPPSEARRPRHHSLPKTQTPQPNSRIPNSQTKQDFARRRDQPEYSCPEGERPPLLRSLPLGEGRVNGRGQTHSSRYQLTEAAPVLAVFEGRGFQLIHSHSYTLVPVASPADAGTARVRAHSRCAAISSARVVESGTVCASASSRDCVSSALFSEYAA